MAEKRTTLIPNYNQQDATFLNLFNPTDALHISGGSFAHHQEHITVHTASGIVTVMIELNGLLVNFYTKSRDKTSVVKILSTPKIKR